MKLIAQSKQVKGEPSLQPPDSDIYTYGNLTPNTMKASKTLVVLDTAVTSIALGWRIALHPYMLHSLQGRKRECNKLCKT